MDRESSVAHFIKYNNAVPIVLGVLFLSTSATMAASPAVRDSVYSSETYTSSVDNSYIVSVDLDAYPFLMRIVQVQEDEQYYYISYDFDTIDILEGVWQDVIRRGELKVAKDLLRGAPLDSYVENELAQVRDWEIRRLKETQSYEQRAGVTQKVVSTEYDGVIGKFFEPKEQELPQYVSEVPKDDPLALEDPQPLLTWDENAEPEEVEPVPPVRPREDDDETPTPTDACPDLEGLQLNESECAPAGGGEEPPAEEPPAEEPPIEEPPVEEPPVEEAPTEEPATQEPAAPEAPAEPSTASEGGA